MYKNLSKPILQEIEETCVRKIVTGNDEHCSDTESVMKNKKLCMEANAFEYGGKLDCHKKRLQMVSHIQLSLCRTCDAED